MALGGLESSGRSSILRNMKKSLLMLPVLFLLGCNEKQSVFFENLKDGATVKSPVKIVFGLSGMELQPAANTEKADCQTCGHHHIIVNYKGGKFIPMGTPIKDSPKEGFYHYGKAQTEASIDLPPGKHTLMMQFANAAHLSYGQAMAETITITVEK